MIAKLIETIQSFVYSTRKEVAYEFLDRLMINMKEELLPSLDSIIASKNLDVIKKNTLFTKIYKNCNIVASDNYKALEKYRECFVFIASQHSALKTLIDRGMQDTLVNKTMNAKSAAIVKVLQDLASMNSYMLDLLYFLILDEKLTNLPKIKLKRIKEDIPKFTEMFKVYGFKLKTIIEEIHKVSEEPLPEDKTRIDVIDALLNNTGKLVDLPVSGFVNNPIYHFRMWLVDRDVKKYESLKEKKQLIELRLMELKLEQEDDSDPNLTKQVKYYEEKLADIEYSIEKFEKN